jgi:hypothetical protein
MKRVMLGFLCACVACLSYCLWVAEFFIGGFFFFSPGWAGTGSASSSQFVMSVGMTVYLLIVLGTALAGVAAIIGFVATLLGIRWEYVGQGRRVWWWFLAGLCCVCALVFWFVYASVCNTFPDGYVIN